MPAKKNTISHNGYEIFEQHNFQINFIRMDWRYNTIWFDLIKEEEQITWHYDKRSNDSLQLSDQRYLMASHYKMKGGLSFEGLPASDKLLYLELTSSNVIDFRGIEKFPALKRLEIQYCLKLKSDAGISALKNSIEILHINQSKKLDSVEEISQLTSLKVLRLNSCGSLANIQFIKKFPGLLDFRFVDTNILDGDLTPILEHPTLKSFGFLNKRHYNYTNEKIDKMLISRDGRENKDFARKGEYETFKYKEMDKV